MTRKGREEKGREGRREGKRGEERREERGGEEGMGGEREWRGEEAFLVMWPRRLSALNPPLINLLFLVVKLPTNQTSVSFNSFYKKTHIRPSSPSVLTLSHIPSSLASFTATHQPHATDVYFTF